MAVTIKDLARETGLTPATISAYFNGGNVRAYNKEKIENALHYNVQSVKEKTIVLKKIKRIQQNV